MGSPLRRFEDELNQYPDRAGGDELHDYMVRLAREARKIDSAALNDVVSAWLERRAEPRTMVAVTIVQELCLVEFRDALLALLADIRAGRCFMPFYERPVQKALDALSAATPSG